MKDFINQALPLVIIGICIAIICAHFSEEKDTYCSEGMSLGMSFGVALSLIFQINLGLGVSIGILIGEAIGILIKKR